MKYQEALKLWAAEKLSVNVEEILTASIDYEYRNGCPTCGGTIEFEVWIIYLKDGERTYKTFPTTLDNILSELFAISGG